MSPSRKPFSPFVNICTATAWSLVTSTATRSSIARALSASPSPAFATALAAATTNMQSRRASMSISPSRKVLTSGQRIGSSILRGNAVGVTDKRAQFAVLALKILQPQPQDVANAYHAGQAAVVDYGKMTHISRQHRGSDVRDAVVRRARDDDSRHERGDRQRMQVGLVNGEAIGNIPLRDHAVDRVPVIAHDGRSDTLLAQLLRERSNGLRRPDGDHDGALHRQNVRHLHGIAPASSWFSR